MSKAVRIGTKNAGKGTIKDEVGEKDKAFVLFYATWCPFSQMFLPIFEEYARDNPEECISVVVDDKPDVCEEYSIEYYPTVILFKKGKVSGRLDAKPGVGLNRNQLKAFTEKL
jgi:thiol-disulfide isomerase/thioredoxin